MNYYLLDALDCLKGSLDQVLTALYQNLYADIVRDKLALY